MPSLHPGIRVRVRRSVLDWYGYPPTHNGLGAVVALANEQMDLWDVQLRGPLDIGMPHRIYVVGALLDPLVADEGEG